MSDMEAGWPFDQPRNGTAVTLRSGVVSIFEVFGWMKARQSGSHIMTKPGSDATLSVPDHREVAKGTLRSLVRAAGLTIDEFLRNA